MHVMQNLRLRQIVSFVLLVIILLVTPVAFWLYNLERIVLNPQTYKTALRTQGFYNDLLPAIVDYIAQNTDDPGAKASLQALNSNMSLDDWAAVADKLLPASWLQNQIEGNINRVAAWFNGDRPTLGVVVDLQEIKKDLTGDNSRVASRTILAKMPACTTQQTALISSAAPNDPINKLPLCLPDSNQLKNDMVNRMALLFNAIGARIPDKWDLAEQARKQGKPINDFELAQVRSRLWVLVDLTVLLFLLPLALLSIIVIILVRTAKTFFRWLGWAVVLSGLITLLPMPFISSATLGLLDRSRGNIQAGMGPGGLVLDSLTSGTINSAAAAVTMAVLVQAAIMIAVGFVALVLSILIHEPEAVTGDTLSQTYLTPVNMTLNTPVSTKIEYEQK